jgi:hypothetical protein
MSFARSMPPSAAPLFAVTHQCHRSAAANISPVQALRVLERAIDLLQPVTPASESVQPLPRSRPVLRVIQGGLSSSYGADST